MSGFVRVGPQADVGRELHVQTDGIERAQGPEGRGGAPLMPGSHTRAGGSGPRAQPASSGRAQPGLRAEFEWVTKGDFSRDGPRWRHDLILLLIRGQVFPGPWRLRESASQAAVIREDVLQGHGPAATCAPPGGNDTEGGASPGGLRDCP